MSSNALRFVGTELHNEDQHEVCVPTEQHESKHNMSEPLRLVAARSLCSISKPTAMLHFEDREFDDMQTLRTDHMKVSSTSTSYLHSCLTNSCSTPRPKQKADHHHRTRGFCRLPHVSRALQVLHQANEDIGNGCPVEKLPKPFTTVNFGLCTTA